MVNEIKIDNIGSGYNAPKDRLRIQDASTCPQSEDGIVITNRMQHYVHLTMKEMEGECNAKRLSSIKHAIHSNTYEVDVDALSKKLSDTFN